MTPVNVRQQTIQNVDRFIYLGSILTDRVVFEAEASGGGGVRQVVSLNLPFPSPPLSIPPKFSDKPVGRKVRSSEGEFPRLPPPPANTILLKEDGDVITDVNCRIGKASAVFRLMRSTWSSPVINTNTKIWLFNATVLSVVTYASETWKITSRIAKKLDVFQQMLTKNTSCIVSGPHHKRGDPTESWVKKTS